MCARANECNDQFYVNRKKECAIKYEVVVVQLLLSAV